MSLNEVTKIEIKCLERLLLSEEIGILSKRVILKEIKRLKTYHQGLVDGYNEEDDEYEYEDYDEDYEEDDDDDYEDEDEDDWFYEE